jgi:hypothetical protein
VHHYPRLNGRSQFFRVGPVLAMLRDVMALWFRLRRGAAADGPAATPAVGGSRPRL